MSKRTIGLLVALIMALGFVAGCSGDDDDSGSTGDDSGGVTVTDDAEGTAVAVEAGEKSDTEMYLTADPGTAPAGKVTFTFSNVGEKEHEMVILKTDTPADELEVGDDDRVSEADSVGEIGETAAGETVTQTFDLEPGNYILVCNIAKHYAQGMYTAFVVS